MHSIVLMDVFKLETFNLDATEELRSSRHYAERKVTSTVQVTTGSCCKVMLTAIRDLLDL